MATVRTEHATLWLVDDVPVRMIFAGQRWRVTDVPTRLREAVWGAPLDAPGVRDGWRFQATDGRRSLVFDLFKSEGNDWHVHHTWE